MIQKWQSTFIITLYTEQTETQSTTQRIAISYCQEEDVPTISYDNCELLITECTQLKLIVGTLYRRPLPNFTLRIQLKDKDTINVFTNVINSFRLWLWLGYFIYFKFTRVCSIVYQLLNLYFNKRNKSINK